MNPKKFFELNKAKSLAVLIGIQIVVLYITKNLELVSGILMVFLGINSLLKVKVDRINFSEKKGEIKKGVYFSVAGIVLGLILQKLFLINFFVEIVLALIILIALKEVYSEKKEKWVNAFVLNGIFLLANGIILLIIELTKFIK